MASRQIPYTTRDFQAIRTELQNYVRTYYPELIQDFNDASVFSVLFASKDSCHALDFIDSFHTLAYSRW